MLFCNSGYSNGRYKTFIIMKFYDIGKVRQAFIMSLLTIGNVMAKMK
jgi:hypothetical protein